jgi:predicted flap endonuclease-1-like 5' DNA nuclease
MNDTAMTESAPGASLIPSSTDAFTAAHLVVLAIFAIAIIAAIVWGSRLKARRKAAERTIASHNVETESAGSPVVAREADAPAVPRAVEPVVETPYVAPAPAPVETIVPAPAPEAPVATPVVEALAPSASTSPAEAPVGTLKGLGPKLATRLNELGITTVGQIAALRDDEAARLDAQLGPFAGRVTRDRWVEQARFLAAGDQAGFEAVFGRL